MPNASSSPSSPVARWRRQLAVLEHVEPQRFVLRGENTQLGEDRPGKINAGKATRGYHVPVAHGRRIDIVRRTTVLLRVLWQVAPHVTRVMSAVEDTRPRERQGPRT